MKQKLELLAPARDAATAIEAIRHGADAVYIGAESFGARAAAGNSIDDIAALCDFAHMFDARIYVTVNTIIYDSEIAAVEKLIARLYSAGVDALIVQDMGLLRMNLPPIALHASTQCDTRSAEKAVFLEKAGFSQLVLARELSLDEISAIRKVTSVPLEVFVHGALCVSYSGDCHAGTLTMGRSANRGECPQICRLRYSLSDQNGKALGEGHWLSLRDMNRMDYLAALARAGASSFKIEGRLKDQGYVRNVVAAYNRALDALVASEPDLWERASRGRVELSFTPDVEKAFNRGFTSYFINGVTAAEKASMAAAASPKFIGKPVGETLAVKGRMIKISSGIKINNGDGIGWFGTNGRLCGARVNRADGNTVFLADYPQGLTPGTVLYRNSDKAWNDLMAGPTATRTIDVDFTLRRCPDGRVALDASDSRGNTVTATIATELQEARSCQTDKRRNTLSRLGDSIYRAANIDDRLGDIFMPASALADLRRQATALLDRAQRLRFRPDRRRCEDRSATYTDIRLSYHDNVANRLAREFYLSHGVESIEPAAEINSPQGHPVVMTTRYCLRRELGQCIRFGAEPGSWRLDATDGGISLRADFDCKHCGMTIRLYSPVFTKNS